MELRDQAPPDDVACGVCRAPVAHQRARLAASREDLVFLELRCAGCGSVTLGFIFMDQATVPETVRLAGLPVVNADDVLDMHRHLEAWRGDLRSLLEPGGSSAPPISR